MSRRNSMIYPDYDYIESKKKNSKLSLDDIDMIPILTKFDKQFINGPLTSYDSTVLEKISDHGFIHNISNLRKKYIITSFQDAQSNPKNNSDEWHLYPKPLPNHWKFENDLRFKNEKVNLVCPINPNDHNKYGYYYPTYEDDHFFGLIPDEQENTSSNGLFKQVHYTGQFFDLDHYGREFQKHQIPITVMQEPKIPSFNEFMDDLKYLTSIITSCDLNSFASKRIGYLLEKFNLFQYLHSKFESRNIKAIPHRDFYNTRKIDTNMLLNGCISQRELNEFIWDKLNLEPERLVFKDVKQHVLSLRDIFKVGCSNNQEADIGLKVIDDEFLEWYNTLYLPYYHIYGIVSTPLDKFKCRDKSEYEISKHSLFFKITKTFLDFDNYIDGEYFAELIIKYVIHNLEKSKYQLAQLSVDFQYFPDISWWYKFSSWICKWRLVSYNIRWNVRLKRDFSKLYSLNYVNNFQDILNIIFTPLFEDKGRNNVGLQYFLSTVCNIDLVVGDDEYIWKAFESIEVKPSEWSAKGDNPPLAYYMYYIYYNLSRVNIQRHLNNQNCISFRNYCPMSNIRVSQCISFINITEQLESLICNILLSNGGLIQGEPLWFEKPILVYIYYLLQIPVVISPLSSISLNHSFNFNANRLLYTHQIKNISVQNEFHYTKNPFMKLSKIGLKIILSSNMVLFNKSYTLEPIIEEYAVAANIYLLSSTDISELVRNSVLCSGYEGFYKKHWLGLQLDKTDFTSDCVGCTDHWYDNSLNTTEKHNVPVIRRKYRLETLENEWVQCSKYK